MAYNQRGLDSSQEQNQQQIIRDTRTLGMRAQAVLKNPHALSIVMVCFALSAFMMGSISELLLMLGVGCFFYGYFQKHSLPFRMPEVSREKDYNDMLPNGKPRMARGIYYFGNDLKTSEELWFTNDDMRTHVLIFGSTGSGKTQALMSIAYNALVQGSGFIYVDGKGDNSLYASVFSMVRSMGREDDLLLINFMTGARDVIGPQEKRLSNTLNPFGTGSSSMLSNLVVSLMGNSKGGGDGDMWKGRAIGFVESLMKVLVAMRDAGYILLDANTIRNYFHLPKIETIVLDKLFPRDGMESVSLENFPSVILEPLYNYVFTLPGFKKESKGKQVSQVFEQHGYIIMQLVRIFTSLADTYGHILRIRLPEVDLSDVVLNRRILCVLLPALEKSPEELSNLGKIIIATLKGMMAAGLGDSVEGDWKDLIERKPTNAETPYLCILDEYGYYAVEGFAVVPAQARSLGFSVIFAGQDLPAFQKASKEEAA
ncbi:MAG: type IV secretion system DNA-binding domain-containing protein, partial [Gammaproteobacteria bacterium]|nr:type IV secretion system DNA-binding domain-containing protein [Gammaproteobacteria bacterium]